MVAPFTKGANNKDSVEMIRNFSDEFAMKLELIILL